MLKLHFINVGDGDAILAEEQEDGRVFRMLVDAGRRDVGRSPGSLRRTAAEYLRERGVSRIDALVVTHLHDDHFGGLEDILPETAVDHVFSGFFPLRPEARAPQEPDAPKTVRGLIECLNQWGADVEVMAAKGCRLHAVTSTIWGLPLTERLRADLICPDEEKAAVQRRVWESMLAGEPVPEELKYWSSKYRNPGSLRVRLEFAGRAVELPGDCCGTAWDNRDQKPCDILKVPHHGAGGALTEAQQGRLRPPWAVISCGSEYIPRKDRPSGELIGQLGRQGGRIWFTDSFSVPGRKPEYWSSVDFTIFEDGTILTPDSRGSGRYAQ